MTNTKNSKTDAAAILRKLCVRPGLQRTTFVVRQHPLVCVDMFFADDEFALRVNWPLKTKTVTLGGADVHSKSKGNWKADKTYRLTDEAVARLAPGLDTLLARVLETI